MKKGKKRVILSLFLLVLFLNLSLNLVYAQCSPDIQNTQWSEWENTTSCNSYNEVNQRRVSIEYDANNCGSIDNKTSYEYRIILCDDNQDTTETPQNKDNFSFLDNKKFIYSLIFIVALLALIILFVLLSRSMFKKKDINELLKEGYKSLRDGDIKNARDTYYKIKKMYDKSGAGGDDSVYLRILEFYDAIMRSSLKSFSFKDVQTNQ